jgi:hypothetical protein
MAQLRAFQIRAAKLGMAQADDTVAADEAGVAEELQHLPAAEAVQVAQHSQRAGHSHVAHRGVGRRRAQPVLEQQLGHTVQVGFQRCLPLPRGRRLLDGGDGAGDGHGHRGTRHPGQPE